MSPHYEDVSTFGGNSVWVLEGGAKSHPPPDPFNFSWPRYTVLPRKIALLPYPRAGALIIGSPHDV
eukprot:scaffold1094_cov185-Alexandrium_tamarense.AAC.3